LETPARKVELKGGWTSCRRLTSFATHAGFAPCQGL
jgi:hypothetical protein